MRCHIGDDSKATEGGGNAVKRRNSAPHALMSTLPGDVTSVLTCPMYSAICRGATGTSSSSKKIANGRGVPASAPGRRDASRVERARDVS